MSCKEGENFSMATHKIKGIHIVELINICSTLSSHIILKWLMSFSLNRNERDGKSSNDPIGH
jgi:hypothetical protein